MSAQQPEDDVYTHGHHESVVRAHAARTAENSAAFVLPYLTPGSTLLDVGCGPGTITCDFAALVSPGKVTGLDRSPDIVAQAQALAVEREVPNVEFVAGNIYDLDFAELDEWMDLYQRIARRNGAEPDAGRRLVSWAQAAGFTDVAPTSSNWLYATAQQRRWQARVWGERVLHSAFAEQALEYGLADAAGLARISAGWHRWGSTDDGWFLIPNGEVIARA